ncbi:hypothetical protein CLD22_05175 [Rubrivivax gelatinosus]|nr:hypothetical protein [Rubrivivax gelatinosus]
MSTAFAPRSTVLALSEAAARALDGRVTSVAALHRRGLSVVLPGGEPIFVGPPGAGLAAAEAVAGSTPAGDDVLIGALVHGWLVDGADSALRRALLPQREALGALTTPLGAAYLRLALDGVFGSHLIQLCQALPDADERLDRRAARVAQHGASSGIDTLLGFVAAHEGRR